MSLIPKRQLPNVNNEKTRRLNSVNTENNIQHAQQNLISFKQTTSSVDKNFQLKNIGNKRNKDVRYDDNGRGHSTFSNEHREIKQENRKITTTKEQLNDRDANNSIVEEVVHPRLQYIKRNREEQQRKLPLSIYNEEDKIFQSPTKSHKKLIESPLQNTKRQLEENEIHKNFLTQQNSATVREFAKSIRENVTQFKNQLMRNEIERKKPVQKDEELSSLLNRRRKPEQDHLQVENEYLIQQQTILSKSTTLNEMLNFKKELEKSERQREELSDHLESLIKTRNEKDKLVSKTLLELKEVTENCDTFERQNTKLQHDLTLALEKLEQMTDEAERFAQESLHSQKQLADSEQKREEFKIQAQETIKQWTARVKKLEKDIDRYKLDSTQILEKNEQLIKEIENFKSQNFTLKEQITKLETDLNETNTNYNQLREQFKQNENTIIQFRTSNSSQEKEITTLKGTINELERQLSIQLQRLSKTDKEKENVEELLQEEIKHRNNLHSKLKQSEKDIQILNTSYSQLENERMNFLQKFKEIQSEKDLLLKEKTKFISIENDYEELKRKLEATKLDYTLGMKALQIDYENKIEMIQVQLSDEKSQNTILQRHEFEHKKEIEKLQDKLSKYEDENTQNQCRIETLSNQINDKSRLIDELESKYIKLTNQKNEILKKDKDYQNSLETIYNEIIYCTECLSNDSNKPFIIEHPTTPHDDIEIWSSKLKAHLAWLKQELEFRHQQEIKLRQDLNNALLNCESDRKYFSSELSKREIIINQFTNKQEYSITINEYDKQKILTEDERDHMDHRYQQFQIMIDSVKRELHTAKIELLS